MSKFVTVNCFKNVSKYIISIREKLNTLTLSHEALSDTFSRDIFDLKWAIGDLLKLEKKHPVYPIPTQFTILDLICPITSIKYYLSALATSKF